MKAKTGMGAAYANARGKNALLPGESVQDRRVAAAVANAKARAKASRKARRQASWSAAASYARARMAETN